MGQGKKMSVPQNISFNELLRGNSIILSTALAKREYLIRYPFERSDLHEDYIVWLKILKEYGGAAGILEPLIDYRLTPGSKSRNKFRSAVMVWNTYMYMGMKVTEALPAFIFYMAHGLKRYVLNG